MRRVFASYFNYRGNSASESEQMERALELYAKAAQWDPSWSVPFFNLGLHTKYQGRWADSLRFNQRATELSSKDMGAWWNLGIAATALRDWREARRAWMRLGIEVSEGDEEWRGLQSTSCVRLDPKGCGEVVWGERIDPARLILRNVPLPESGRRFRDIVLHDGMANGERMLGGETVPVFDELALWSASSFSTYAVTLEGPDGGAKAALIDRCEQRGLGVEDWSTMRWLCDVCSRGNPGPHACQAGTPSPLVGRFGIAAPGEDLVREVLSDWASATGCARPDDIELLLPA